MMIMTSPIDEDEDGKAGETKHLVLRHMIVNVKLQMPSGAMKALGIPPETVKPVLINLLRLVIIVILVRVVIIGNIYPRYRTEVDI